MPTYRCECGAKYRFPDSAIGKKAKCKKCSAVFRLEEEEAGPIALAGEVKDTEGAHAPPLGMFVPTAHEFESAPALSLPPSAPQVEGAPTSPPLVAPPTPARGYGHSILWAVLFPTAPRSLMIFAAVWVIVAFVGAIPLIGWVVMFWYAAFQFAVIESGAAGEEDLPGATFGSDIIAGLVVPFFKWIGSWALVMLPTVIYVFVQARPGSGTTNAVFAALLSGTGGLVKAFGADPTLFVLFGAGLFIWPMVILCIALGDFGALLRVDLVIVTLIKSFPAYAATIVIVVGATAAAVFLDDAISAGFAPAPGAGLGGTIGSAVVMYVLAVGAQIYCDIVMLRAIGLYYHHFKHRFAWSWG